MRCGDFLKQHLILQLKISLSLNWTSVINMFIKSVAGWASLLHWTHTSCCYSSVAISADVIWVVLQKTQQMCWGRHHCSIQIRNISLFIFGDERQPFKESSQCKRDGFSGINLKGKSFILLKNWKLAHFSALLSVITGFYFANLKHSLFHISSCRKVNIENDILRKPFCHWHAPEFTVLIR